MQIVARSYVMCSTKTGTSALNSNNICETFDWLTVSSPEATIGRARCGTHPLGRSCTLWRVTRMSSTPQPTTIPTGALYRILVSDGILYIFILRVILFLQHSDVCRTFKNALRSAFGCYIFCYTVFQFLTAFFTYLSYR